MFVSDLLPTFGYFTADDRFHRAAGTALWSECMKGRGGGESANNTSSDCIVRPHILSHLTLQHFKTNIVFLSNIYKQFI